MPQRPKRLEFEVALDPNGRLSAENCPPIELPDEWTSEHLLLAGFARCSVSSLRYHAKRRGITVRGDAEARGLVTKREEDERYAFVEVECRMDVVLDPPPDDLPALLASAERDCFLGASLTTTPRYYWRVNGAEV